MEISNGFNGFLKGLGLVAVLAALSYAGNAANLGWLSPALATLITGLASALESSIKANTGNGLLGAVRVH